MFFDFLRQQLLIVLEVLNFTYKSKNIIVIIFLHFKTAFLYHTIIKQNKKYSVVCKHNTTISCLIIQHYINLTISSSLSKTPIRFR